MSEKDKKPSSPRKPAPKPDPPRPPADTPAWDQGFANGV